MSKITALSMAILIQEDYIKEADTKLPLIKALRRNEGIHQRIAEMQCNGGWYRGIDFSNTNQDEPNNPIAKLEARIEGKIKDICKQINPSWEPVFQGDPRGYTVRIMDRSKDADRQDITWLVIE